MDLNLLYNRLQERFEVEDWWPSESAFEVMVGAILTHQTNWDSVEKSLNELRRKGLLEPGKLAYADTSMLEEAIRPCGFYRQKAERIRGLALHIQLEYEGIPELLLNKEIGSAREELLSLKGVGKETADSILLFAGKRSKFVPAAYVLRILSRTGLLDSTDYDEVQQYVESRFSDDPVDLGRLYALFVQLAKTYCRPDPRCVECPLEWECRTGLAQGKK
jgi:endonuclease-3 related protein